MITVLTIMIACTVMYALSKDKAEFFDKFSNLCISILPVLIISALLEIIYIPYILNLFWNEV